MATVIHILPREASMNPLYDSTNLRASFGVEKKNPRTNDGTPKKLQDWNPSGVAAAVEGAKLRIEVAMKALAGLDGDKLDKEMDRLSREMTEAVLGLYRSGIR